jgi:hypothetical protein
MLVMVASSKLKAQVSKKLDGKDVVILTLDQARNINRTIDSLENALEQKTLSVNRLNDSTLSLTSIIKAQRLINQSFKDSLDNNQIALRDSVFLLRDIKNRYEKNLVIYQKYEKKTDNEILMHRASSIAFFFLSYFLFTQIK